MAESTYDLFISYARGDNQQGRVTSLVERIAENYRAFTGGNELRFFFDKGEIRGMDDWRHRILDGVKNTRLLLVFLSPNYLRSEYCGWEVDEYLKHEASRSLLGEGIAPVYFVEVPGWKDREFEQRTAERIEELRRRQQFDLRPWFDEGLEALHSEAVESRLHELNQQIRERMQRIAAVIDAKGNISRHNEHFVGRTAELRLLRERVGLGKVGSVTAIQGLGGVGKTALAIEYAHAFAHEYPGGCWLVACEGSGDLRAVLMSLQGARDLKFEFTEKEKANLDLGFERVLHELHQRAEATQPGRVLILLDNVEQSSLLTPAMVQRLPQDDWLHLIVTTRLAQQDLFPREKDRSFLAIDELPEDDAVALIEGYQPDGRFVSDSERAAAREIVQLLGRFPLAVEAAALFLGRYAKEISCADFRQRLEREGLTALENATGDATVALRHGQKSLTATLHPSWERLSAAEKQALIYAALLPADGVALPWIRSLLALTFPPFGQDAEPGYPDPWLTLANHLLGLRFLHFTGDFDAEKRPRLVRMHRLVGEFVRAEAGAEAMAKSATEVTSQIESRAAILLEQASLVDSQWEIDALDMCAWRWILESHPKGPWLLGTLASLFEKQGKFVFAELLVRSLLESLEKTGSNLLDVATAVNNLANVLLKTERETEAEPLYRRALSIRERNLAANDPEIAASLNNLAACLKTNPHEAETLYRRALAIRERALGRDHPDVAASLYNWAALLSKEGRPAEAEPLYRRALSIQERTLPPDNPDFGLALNGLANLVRETKPDEAEQLYRRALAIRERSCGPESAQVADSLNNLGLLLATTDRSGEAEPLYRRAFEIERKRVEPDPSRPAASLRSLTPLVRVATNLCNLLEAGSRQAELLTVYHNLLACETSVLGPEHPNLLPLLRNIGLTLSDLDQRAEAEPFFRRALDIQEKNLGPEHPDLTENLISLGINFMIMDRPGDAAPFLSRILRIFVATQVKTGEERSDLVFMIQAYASALKGSGQSKAQIKAEIDALIRPIGKTYG